MIRFPVAGSTLHFVASPSAVWARPDVLLTSVYSRVRIRLYLPGGRGGSCVTASSAVTARASTYSLTQPMAPGRQGNWIPSIQKTSAPCTAEHRVSSYPVDFTGTCICPHLARHVYIERCMTPSDITAQILAILESSMEDTRIPDTIAEYADKRVGKPVTKTDAAQLETQLGVPVRIRRQYGMTHVSWTTGEGSPRDERSILLAHSEKNVSWPSAPELRQGEPAYFTARDTRNEARRTLLAEHHQMDRIPCVNPSRIERAALAISKLLTAQEELQQLMDYGQPMHVINGAIEKLTGKN